jgi:hypothetical protein
MISVEHRISHLEQQRRNLNEKLMNAPDPAEANAVERELWAIRTAIAYYKSGLRRPVRIKPRTGPMMMQL